MRTKTLLLTAALSAAGMMYATAQDAVYSVNVVGYAKKTVPAGEFALLSNPLNVTAAEGNTLDNVLPDAPIGTEVFEWNGAGFDTYTKAEVLGSIFWDGADENTALDPDEGFFVRNTSGEPLELVFVGEVMQGDLSVPLVSGFSLVGSMVPQQGAVTEDLGLVPEVGDTLFQWNGAGYDSAQYSSVLGNDFWETEEPVIGVAEGFFYQTATARDWARTFNVE